MAYSVGRKNCVAVILPVRNNYSQDAGKLAEGRNSHE